jgi:hypothetical protein
MAIVRNSEIKVLIAPADIFKAKIETEEIMMDNFGAAHFIITSGAGAGAKVLAQVVATDAEGKQEKVLAEREIQVGEKKVEKIVVDADYMAHDNFDRVYLKIASAGKADLLGAVHVILTNERYSSDQSR